MYQILIVFQVLVGLGVIGLVLMQQGKGADAGAAFGSGASGTVFGAQGSASFLSRATAVLALLFFTTSLGLAILVGHRDEQKDLMDIPEVEQTMPDIPVISDNGEPASVPSISQQQASEMPGIEVTETVEKIPEAVEVIEAVDESGAAIEVIEPVAEPPAVETPSAEAQPEAEGQPEGN